MIKEWKISEELTDDKHIIIDTGEKRGCILLERHIEGQDLDDMPNAHLIASAPGLYQTLKDILPFVINESAQKLIVLNMMKARGEL